MAVPAASMSLAAQRELAQSIRQEMGIPPDEEDEALAVCAPPLYHAAHPCFVHQVANLAFGRVLDKNLWRITNACTLTWEGFCLRNK